MGAGEYNLFRILVWPGGGAIGGLLWLMSVGTVGVTIMLFVSVRRGTIMPDYIRQQIVNLFENRQYREAIELTSAQPDYLSNVIHAALTEAPHGYAAMERSLEEAAEDRTMRLMRHIEWLNLIGNISPMFGLLGTVWGMIRAFFDIVRTGTPDPGQLAGSIGIALVTTLLGLGIAIPALACYAILRNRVDALSAETVMVAEDLIRTFRPAPGKKQA